jgi:hypothetical protein
VEAMPSAMRPRSNSQARPSSRPREAGTPRQRLSF